MKAEDYRQKRAEEPKGKGKLSKRKSQMLATSQERNPITSPQLRKDYSSKIEWARKLIPKLKKEAEASEEKEEPG
jgi:predicted HTH transcriptional regulator